MNQNPSPAPIRDQRNVSVTLDGNNRIVVRVGTERRVGNTYYLGLSPESPDGQPATAAEVQSLLLNWIRLLTTSADGFVYLPFDFSDEFTQWIACQKNANDVLMTFGWAPTEGWAIELSDLSSHAFDLPGFTPNEPLFVQQFYLPRVLSDLRHATAEIGRASGNNRHHQAAQSHSTDSDP